jgi:glycosyltransferase involved in cell wall biosynthesis
MRRACGRTGKPRIALVCHDAVGGTGVGNVITELLARTDEVDLVVFARTLAPELRGLVGFRRVPAPSRPYLLTASVFFVVSAVRLLFERVDLVHVHANGPLTARRADLLTVHYLRAAANDALGGDVRATTRLHHAVEFWCARRARILAALSEGSRRELRARFPAARIVVTPNGVDGGRFRPDARARAAERAANGARDGDLVAVFVGNAWTRKGLHVAVEALAETANVVLWVVGWGDPRRLAALTERHRVGERVRFLGMREDVERVLAGADAFVLPSAYENHCLAVLEAAACGLPLVVTDVSGMAEHVGDDEAGFLVERTPAAVAAALNELAADPGLRERLGREARGRALDFTWERSLASVLAAYDQLLPEPVSQAAKAAG